MSTTQDALKSGLSLAPDDKEHISALLQKTEEAIDQICSGQGDPWLTTLRDAAEQREDLRAARRACHCLALYYSGTLENSNRKIADYDRSLYYAQTLKDCGPDSQGLYHAVYGMALLIQVLNHQSASDATTSATEHLYAALRAGESCGADFVIGNSKRLCEGLDPCQNWGLLYAAYQFRAHDPEFSPLQQEEAAAKAAALLQRVLDDMKKYSYTGENLVMIQHYPKQLAMARESRPTPEDEAVLQQIQHLVSSKRLYENPLVRRGREGLENLKLTLLIFSPILIIGGILILIGMFRTK